MMRTLTAVLLLAAATCTVVPDSMADPPTWTGVSVSGSDSGVDTTAGYDPTVRATDASLLRQPASSPSGEINRALAIVRNQFDTAIASGTHTFDVAYDVNGAVSSFFVRPGYGWFKNVYRDPNHETQLLTIGPGTPLNGRWIPSNDESASATVTLTCDGTTTIFGGDRLRSTYVTSSLGTVTVAAVSLISNLSGHYIGSDDMPGLRNEALRLQVELAAGRSGSCTVRVDYSVRAIYAFETTLRDSYLTKVESYGAWQDSAFPLRDLRAWGEGRAAETAVATKTQQIIYDPVLPVFWICDHDGAPGVPQPGCRTYDLGLVLAGDLAARNIAYTDPSTGTTYTLNSVIDAQGNVQAAELAFPASTSTARPSTANMKLVTMSATTRLITESTWVY